MTSQDDFNALVEPTEFAQIGKVHVDLCQGDGASAHVLAWLVSVTLRGERWYPVSGEVVGEELGYSPKQAKRILGKLRDLGLVTSRRIHPWNPALEYNLTGGAR